MAIKKGQRSQVFYLSINRSADKRVAIENDRKFITAGNVKGDGGMCIPPSALGFDELFVYGRRCTGYD